MFDYGREPGKTLIKRKYRTKSKPTISIIVPFYNDDKHIRQTINALLNQTYPLFELLIIDDGSTKKEALDELNEISKLDERIKIFHKENTGVSDTRDYGASISSECTKYLVFCDSDDLLDKTYLECGYLTLESNIDASFTYTDAVCFDEKNYLWNRFFDSEVMKYENLLVNSNMIRKDAFKSVGGYEYKEKKIYEDWNLWLKLIRDKKFPVKMNYYGCWYRVKKQGEYASSINTNHKRAMQIIKKTVSQIKDTVYAISYPRYVYEKNNLKFKTDFKYDKSDVVVIYDKNFDIKDLKNKTVISIIVDDTDIRQQIEGISLEYFNLTTFLDQSYWDSFIKYIIETRNIDSNIDIKLPNEKDYNEDVEKYNRKYNYPDINTLHFFHNHKKMYKYKIKLDNFSLKHNFYNKNINFQKKIFKILKGVKK